MITKEERYLLLLKDTLGIDFEIDNSDTKKYVFTDLLGREYIKTVSEIGEIDDTNFYVYRAEIVDSSLFSKKDLNEIEIKNYVKIEFTERTHNYFVFTITTQSGDDKIVKLSKSLNPNKLQDRLEHLLKLDFFRDDIDEFRITENGETYGLLQNDQTRNLVSLDNPSSLDALENSYGITIQLDNTTGVYTYIDLFGETVDMVSNGDIVDTGLREITITDGMDTVDLLEVLKFKLSESVTLPLLSKIEQQYNIRYTLNNLDADGYYNKQISLEDSDGNFIAILRFENTLDPYEIMDAIEAVVVNKQIPAMNLDEDTVLSVAFGSITLESDNSEGTTEIFLRDDEQDRYFVKTADASPHKSLDQRIISWGDHSEFYDESVTQIKNTTISNISVTHEIMVVLDSDLTIEGSRFLAKYPHNITILQMNSLGQLSYVYGDKLEDIKNKSVNLSLVAHSTLSDGMYYPAVYEDPEQLTNQVVKLKDKFGENVNFENIKLISCSVDTAPEDLDDTDRYGYLLKQSLNDEGIDVGLYAASTVVSIDENLSSNTFDIRGNNTIGSTEFFGYYKYLTVINDDDTKTIVRENVGSRPWDDNIDDWTKLSNEQKNTLDEKVLTDPENKTNYDHTIVIQLDNSSEAFDAAYSLTLKNIPYTTFVQLDSYGELNTIYGASFSELEGSIRIQLVGNGTQEDLPRFLAGRDAKKLASQIDAIFSTDESEFNHHSVAEDVDVKKISLVSCNISTSDDPSDNPQYSDSYKEDFADRFLRELADSGNRFLDTVVTARDRYVAVDVEGHKFTALDFTENVWSYKSGNGKLEYSITTDENNAEVISKVVVYKDTTKQEVHAVLQHLGKKGDIQAQIAKIILVDDEANQSFVEDFVLKNFNCSQDLPLILKFENGELFGLFDGETEVLLARRENNEWQLQQSLSDNTQQSTWDGLSSIDIAKLDGLQATYPSKHHIIVQLEGGALARKTAIDYALHTPASHTTIIQMDKDGNYQVIYPTGVSLDNIMDNVTLTLVGYSSVDSEQNTLFSGRSVNELVSQVNTIANSLADEPYQLQEAKLVGTNLGSDVINRLDLNENSYGRSFFDTLSADLNVSVSVKNAYSNTIEGTETSSWKPYTLDAETAYELVNGKVIIKKFNGDGVLVNYNGVEIFSQDGRKVVNPETLEDEAKSTLSDYMKKIKEVYSWITGENSILPDFNFKEGLPLSIEFKNSVTNKVRNLLLNDFKVSNNDTVINKLTELFVDALTENDIDKYLEFCKEIEKVGYSFDVKAETSNGLFWSGNPDVMQPYLDVLQKKLMSNNFSHVSKVAAADFLWKFLDKLGDSVSTLDLDSNEQMNIEKMSRTMFSLLSSAYAAGTRNDIYVFAPEGLKLGRFFWNSELPVLRALQKEGLIKNIYVLDKEASYYANLPSGEEFTHKVSLSDYTFRVRFDYLNEEMQYIYRFKELSLEDKNKLLNDPLCTDSNKNFELLSNDIKKQLLIKYDVPSFKDGDLISTKFRPDLMDKMFESKLPFYQLRVDTDIMVEKTSEGYILKPYADTINSSSKFIRLSDIDDMSQVKTMQKFILANYNNYAEVPPVLSLQNDTIYASYDGKVEIVLAQKDATGFFRYTLPGLDSINNDVDSWKSFSSMQLMHLSIDEDVLMKNYNHQILIQLEDSPATLNLVRQLAQKHTEHTTVIQMSKDGNYRVIHGKTLDKIEGDIRISAVGHGSSSADKSVKLLGDRTEEQLASHIDTLKSDLNEKTKISKVGLIGCNLGGDSASQVESDYGKNLIVKLATTYDIETSVSVRSAYVGVNSDGQKVTSEDGIKTNDGGVWKYHDGDAKTVYSYTKGTLVQESINAEGTIVNYNDDVLWKSDREMFNERLSKVLSQLDILPQNILHLQLKTLTVGISKDEINLLKVYAQEHPELTIYTKNQLIKPKYLTDVEILKDFSKIFEKMSFSNAYNEIRKKLNTEFMHLLKSDIEFQEIITKGLEGENDRLLKLYERVFQAKKTAFQNILDIDLGDVRIELDSSLETFGRYMSDDMKVLVNTNYVEQHLSTEDYNKMVVDVMVHELTHHEQNVLTQHIQNSHLESIKSDIELLNINYKSVYLQSSIVENTIYKAQPIEKEAFHVGTQYSKYLVGTVWKLKDLDNPFSPEDLKEWNELLSIQENILRNSAEITLMKNHKHQIILILENDPIAKYSAFKLALKHPENTTILDKDGNNIYGKSLDGIDGNIRITAVGHGNTFEDGTKTIGGQDVDTLLQTIQDLNGQLSDTTIKTVSLVGCNLGINHHIDNTDSYDYGKELIQKLHDNNLDPEVHVRNGYVGVTEDGQKVTRATVNEEWKNQDSDAKIVYQIVEGEVKTQEYNNEGKIVKYNGHSLGYEFDSYREAAMESGIPEHLIEEYRQLAVDKQSDMYFRFVNPLSTSLIENGYATKGLDVHGKSASDGFAAGFIPVDQNLSKMFGDISRLPKAFEDMQKNLDAGFQKVKLVLTESRIQELLEKGKIFIDDEGIARVIDSPLSQAYDFKLSYTDDNSDEQKYSVEYKLKNSDENWQVLEVLGTKIDSEHTVSIPLTADIDMFAIAPNMKHFSRQNSEDSGISTDYGEDEGKVFKRMFSTNSSVSSSSEGWAVAINGVRNMLGIEDRRHVTGSKGVITKFELDMVEKMNHIAHKSGMQDVVNHGTEQNNPFPEPDQAVFVISADGKMQIVQPNELQDFRHQRYDEGFYMYENRKKSSFDTIKDEITTVKEVYVDWSLDDLSLNDKLKLETFLKKYTATITTETTLEEFRKELIEHFGLDERIIKKMLKHPLKSEILPFNLIDLEMSDFKTQIVGHGESKNAYAFNEPSFSRYLLLLNNDDFESIDPEDDYINMFKEVKNQYVLKNLFDLPVAKVYGMVNIDGKLGYIVENVENGILLKSRNNDGILTEGNINPLKESTLLLFNKHTREDLLKVKKMLLENPKVFLQDFQFMIKPDGHIKIIDVEILYTNSDDPKRLKLLNSLDAIETNYITPQIGTPDYVGTEVAIGLPLEEGFQTSKALLDWISVEEKVLVLDVVNRHLKEPLFNLDDLRNSLKNILGLTEGILQDNPEHPLHKDSTVFDSLTMDDLQSDGDDSSDHKIVYSISDNDEYMVVLQADTTADTKNLLLKEMKNIFVLKQVYGLAVLSVVQEIEIDGRVGFIAPVPEGGLIQIDGTGQLVDSDDNPLDDVTKDVFSEKTREDFVNIKRFLLENPNVILEDVTFVMKDTGEINLVDIELKYKADYTSEDEFYTKRTQLIDSLDDIEDKYIAPKVGEADYSATELESGLPIDEASLQEHGKLTVSDLDAIGVISDGVDDTMATFMNEQGLFDSVADELRARGIIDLGSSGDTSTDVPDTPDVPNPPDTPDDGKTPSTPDINFKPIFEDISKSAKTQYNAAGAFKVANIGSSLIDIGTAASGFATADADSVTGKMLISASSIGIIGSTSDIVDAVLSNTKFGATPTGVAFAGAGSALAGIGGAVQGAMIINDWNDLPEEHQLAAGYELGLKFGGSLTLIVSGIAMGVATAKGITSGAAVVGPAVGAAAGAMALAISPLQIQQLIDKADKIDKLEELGNEMAGYGYDGDSLLAELLEESLDAEIGFLGAQTGIALGASIASIIVAATAAGGPVGIIVGLVAGAIGGILTAVQQPKLEEIADEYREKILSQGSAQEYFDKNTYAQLNQMYENEEFLESMNQLQQAYGVDGIVNLDGFKQSSTSLELAATTKLADQMRKANNYATLIRNGVHMEEDRQISLNSKTGIVDINTAADDQLLIRFNTPLFAPGVEESKREETGKNEYYTDLVINGPDHYTINDSNGSNFLQSRDKYVTSLYDVDENLVKSIHLVVNANGGDDTIYMDSGKILYNGGSGIDSVIYNQKTIHGIVVTADDDGTGFTVTKNLVNTAMVSEVANTQETSYGKRGETVVYRDMEITHKNITETDHLKNVEVIVASDYDDTLHGSDNNDFFVGRDGNDTLYGYDGDDTLKGGIGQDSMFGGEGNDYFIQDDSVDDADTIVGGEGVDTIDYSQISFSKNILDAPLHFSFKSKAIPISNMPWEILFESKSVDITLPNGTKNGETFWIVFPCYNASAKYSLTYGVKVKVDISHDQVHLKEIDTRVLINEYEPNYDFENTPLIDGKLYSTDKFIIEQVTINSDIIINEELTGDGISINIDNLPNVKDGTAYQYILIKRDVSDLADEEKFMHLDQLQVFSDGVNLLEYGLHNGGELTASSYGPHPSIDPIHNLYYMSNGYFRTSNGDEQWIQIKLDRATHIDDIKIVGSGELSQDVNSNIKMYFGNEDLSNMDENSLEKLPSTETLSFDETFSHPGWPDPSIHKSATYKLGEGIIANLETDKIRKSSQNVDFIESIENVVGSKYDDIIKGNGSDNVLSGNSGDDELQGRGGNDVLIGGTGNDSLDGGAGNDVFIQSDALSKDSFIGGIGQDVLSVEQIKFYKQGVLFEENFQKATFNTIFTDYKLISGEHHTNTNPLGDGEIQHTSWTGGNIRPAQGNDWNNNEDKFLLINNMAQDYSKLFYKQQVYLVGGQKYTLSFDSVEDSGGSYQLMVDDVDLQKPIDMDDFGQWKNYTITFTAEKTGLQTVGLANLATTQVYCAIDNIKLEGAMEINPISELIFHESFEGEIDDKNTDYNVITEVQGHGTASISNTTKWGLGSTYGDTGKDDSFFFVDGSTDNSKLVYKKDVELYSTMEYKVTFKVSSNNHTQLQFTLNGKDIADSITPKNGSGWEEYTVTFTPSQDGIQTFGLRDLNTYAGGNDFAIDDIKLECIGVGNYWDHKYYEQDENFRKIIDLNSHNNDGLTSNIEGVPNEVGSIDLNSELNINFNQNLASAKLYITSFSYWYSAKVRYTTFDIDGTIIESGVLNVPGSKYTLDKPNLILKQANFSTIHIEAIDGRFIVEDRAEVLRFGDISEDSFEEKIIVDLENNEIKKVLSSNYDSDTISTDYIEGIENIIGSKYNDTLKGDGKDNVILGGEGNDYIEGKDGNDSLNAGRGSDIVDGGEGNDEFIQSDYETSDTLIGGEGVDILLTTSLWEDKHVVLHEDFGNISLNRDNTDYTVVDTIAGHDKIQIATKTKWGIKDLYGKDGQGDKFLFADGATDSSKLVHKYEVYLKKGCEYTYSFYGIQNSTTRLQLTVDGEDINDAIALDHYGNWKQYEITFTAQESGMKEIGLRDLSTSAGGNDFAIDDIILINNDYEKGISVDLEENELNKYDVIDRVESIENVKGTLGDDSIVGNRSKNLLMGLDGDDYLSGGENNDTLIGGFGEDTILGGNGEDVIKQMDRQYTDTIDGGTGIDTLDLSKYVYKDEINLTPSNADTVVEKTVNEDEDLYQYIFIRRDVSNEAHYNKCINLGEINIGSRDIDLTNHVEKTTMSSLYSNLYTTDKLFDKDSSTFAHTNLGNEQWIQIKLDKAYSIDHLEIIGRSGWNSRNKNMDIYLGNEELSSKSIEELNSFDHIKNISFNGREFSVNPQEINSVYKENISLEKDKEYTFTFDTTQTANREVELYLNGKAISEKTVLIGNGNKEHYSFKFQLDESDVVGTYSLELREVSNHNYHANKIDITNVQYESLIEKELGVTVNLEEEFVEKDEVIPEATDHVLSMKGICKSVEKDITFTLSSDFVWGSSIWVKFKDSYGDLAGVKVQISKNSDGGISIKKLEGKWTSYTDEKFSNYDFNSGGYNWSSYQIKDFTFNDVKVDGNLPYNTVVDMDVELDAEPQKIIDSIKNIENVTGTEFNDSLIGDDNNNILKGNKGDDFINGKEGDDTLDGGLGDDSVLGGSGRDYIKQNDREGNDYIDGGIGTNTLDLSQMTEYKTSTLIFEEDFTQGIEANNTDYQTSMFDVVTTTDTNLGSTTGIDDENDKFLLVQDISSQTQRFYKHEGYLIEGHEYKFVFYATTNSGINLQADIDGEDVATTIVPSDNSKWTKYEVSFVAQKTGMQTIGLKNIYKNDDTDTTENQFGLDKIQLFDEGIAEGVRIDLDNESLVKDYSVLSDENVSFNIKYTNSEDNLITEAVSIDLSSNFQAGDVISHRWNDSENSLIVYETKIKIDINSSGEVTSELMSFKNLTKEEVSDGMYEFSSRNDSYSIYLPGYTFYGWADGLSNWFTYMYHDGEQEGNDVGYYNGKDINGVDVQLNYEDSNGDGKALPTGDYLNPEYSIVYDDGSEDITINFTNENVTSAQVYIKEYQDGEVSIPWKAYMDDQLVDSGVLTVFAGDSIDEESFFILSNNAFNKIEIEPSHHIDVTGISNISSPSDNAKWYCKNIEKDHSLTVDFKNQNMDDAQMIFYNYQNEEVTVTWSTYLDGEVVNSGTHTIPAYNLYCDLFDLPDGDIFDQIVLEPSNTIQLVDIRFDYIVDNVDFENDGIELLTIPSNDAYDGSEYAIEDITVGENTLTGALPINGKDVIVGQSDVALDSVKNIQNVFGTQFDDVIKGDEEANLINGLDGDDIIYGGTNNDILNGGLGNDSLIGGNDNDIIIQSDKNGKDFIDGGLGKDRIDFSTIEGMKRDINLTEDFESYSLPEEYSQGYISNSFDKELVVTNTSSDESFYEYQMNFIKDTKYTIRFKLDTDIGVEINRSFKLMFNNEEITLFNTLDSYLYGQNWYYEAEFTAAKSGFDTIGIAVIDDASAEGDFEIDDIQIHYQPSIFGVTADLETNTVTKELNVVDTIKNIEDVIGTHFSDIIKGDGENNTLLGLNGDDDLFGGKGNDRLEGGYGINRLQGEEGNDVYVTLLESSNYIIDPEGKNSLYITIENDSVYEYSNYQIKTFRENSNLIIKNYSPSNQLLGMSIIKDYFNSSLDTPKIEKIYIEHHELIIDYETINTKPNSEYSTETQIDYTLQGDFVAKGDNKTYDLSEYVVPYEADDKYIVNIYDSGDGNIYTASPYKDIYKVDEHSEGNTYIHEYKTGDIEQKLASFSEDGDWSSLYIADLVDYISLEDNGLQVKVEGFKDGVKSKLDLLSGMGLGVTDSGRGLNDVALKDNETFILTFNEDIEKLDMQMYQIYNIGGSIDINLYDNEVLVSSQTIDIGSDEEIKSFLLQNSESTFNKVEITNKGAAYFYLHGVNDVTFDTIETEESDHINLADFPIELKSLEKYITFETSDSDGTDVIITITNPQTLEEKVFVLYGKGDILSEDRTFEELVEYYNLVGIKDMQEYFNEDVTTTIGDSTDNTLVGSNTDDDIFGREGDDRLEGGLGINRLQGEENDDIYVSLLESTTYIVDSQGNNKLYISIQEDSSYENSNYQIKTFREKSDLIIKNYSTTGQVLGATIIKDYFNSLLDTPTITNIYVEDHELIIDYNSINSYLDSEYKKQTQIKHSFQGSFEGDGDDETYDLSNYFIPYEEDEYILNIHEKGDDNTYTGSSYQDVFKIYDESDGITHIYEFTAGKVGETQANFGANGIWLGADEAPVDELSATNNGLGITINASKIYGRGTEYESEVDLKIYDHTLDGIGLGATDSSYSSPFLSEDEKFTIEFDNDVKGCNAIIYQQFSRGSSSLSINIYNDDTLLSTMNVDVASDETHKDIFINNGSNPFNKIEIINDSRSFFYLNELNDVTFDTMVNDPNGDKIDLSELLIDEQDTIYDYIEFEGADVEGGDVTLTVTNPSDSTDEKEIILYGKGNNSNSDKTLEELMQHYNMEI